MAIVAESFDFVVGVDTHAKTHTLAVVTAGGLVADTRTFPTSSQGLGRATSWVSKHTGGAGGCARVLVSMEGTGSYGARLAAGQSGQERSDQRPARCPHRPARGHQAPDDAQIGEPARGVACAGGGPRGDER
jgi:transposase